MGLLRSLMRLFAPPRQARRYQPPESYYRPPPAPAEAIPTWHRVQEPSQHVAVQTKQHIVTRQHILKGRCWIIDGDTIVINKTHVRLSGVDAPELDHPYGQRAKSALMQLCRGQVVTAVLEEGTSYERAVGKCYLEDGRDLSAEMVKAGFALDWAKHSGGRYRHLEGEGIRKKLWRADAKQKGRMPPSVKVEHRQ